VTVNAKTGRTPFRVGLTGGIASGKSTVANMFAGLGAVVIDTDVIAREVVAPGQPALDEIAQTFGESVLTAAGGLDRVAMRQLVFSDDDARKRLEAIVHPRIQEETRRQSAQAGGIYQIIAIPLLVESTLKSFVDRILVVDCDEETQIRRLLVRDAESEAQARRMLAAQTSRSERLAIADDVISNDQTLADTQDQVTALHEIYRSLA
jgi:dephospho-CoA kinase